MVVRVLASGVFALLIGCGTPDVPETPSAPDPVSPERTAPAAARSTATHTATGVVRSVTPSGSHVMIRHGDIPGFMDAMTMAFAVAEPSLVDNVARDDSVRFRFTVSAEGTVIRKIARVE
jgi:Cu/Ag efflux protein CusF